MMNEAQRLVADKPLPTDRVRHQRFGAYLQQLRLAAGINSQKEAAEKISNAGYTLSRNGVAQLEMGRVLNPRNECLAALAVVHKVSPLSIIAHLVQDQRQPWISDGIREFFEFEGYSAPEVHDRISRFAKEPYRQKHICALALHLRRGFGESIITILAEAFRNGVEVTILVPDEERSVTVVAGEEKVGHVKALEHRLSAIVGPKMVSARFCSRALPTGARILSLTPVVLLLGDGQPVEGYQHLHVNGLMSRGVIRIGQNLLEQWVTALRSL